MQQSYAEDLECQNERLRHQLVSLGLDPRGAETSTARPQDQSDDPARGWSPWPDTYQYDDPVRGWSPWPDSGAHDD